MSTVEPTPRAVSEEDREAAIDKIYETPCFNESVMNEWHRPTMGSAMKIVDTLISHGWGPTRQTQVDTLLAARDAAREARRLCWADDRDEHTIRHWGATAGWLASRAKKIQAGEEPDWPDAANSARTEVLDDAE